MNSSGESLDLRVRRTHKLLWEALMSLLAERDFESITVTAICERAMVHRTTFYKHYEDKYALLSDGIHKELNALFEVLDRALDQALEMDQEPDPLARFITVFEHILEYERFYRLMLTGDGFSKFSTLLKKSLADRIERRIRGGEKRSSMPLSLHAQLHAAAIITMVAWWLENDRPYTPVEMTQLLQHHLATRFQFSSIEY